MDSNQTSIIDAISFQVTRELGRLRMEEFHPQRTADDSDRFIKDQAQMISRLRDIRHELEEIFTQVR